MQIEFVGGWEDGHTYVSVQQLTQEAHLCKWDKGQQ